MPPVLRRSSIGWSAISRQKGRQMYDQACGDLALHFLGDSHEKLIEELAQHIQNEIENWIEYQAAERAKALGVPAPSEH